MLTEQEVKSFIFEYKKSFKTPTTRAQVYKAVGTKVEVLKVTRQILKNNLWIPIKTKYWVNGVEYFKYSDYLKAAGELN